MFILNFIIKHPLYFDLILISICLIGLLWCMLDCFKPKNPLKQELKRIEQKKQEHIKWQINQNLAAKKRKKAIYDLMDSFDFRDIKLDEKSDKFYVIIKINKDALIEREVK